ncbi:MAG: hypothetical protein ABH848_03500 [Candidatus Omnitrophota bacterium]
MAKRLIAKKIGELLIERKFITKEQLDEALELRKKKGGFTGEILIELGYTTEESIAQALTAQYGFPYLPLDNYDISPEVVKIIPKNVAVKFCLVPIDKIGNNLTIAMSNPLNSIAIEDIELISGLCVQIFVSTVTDIKKAIKKYY